MDRTANRPARDEPLSESLNRELSRVLGEIGSTHELWEKLRELSLASPGDLVLTQSLRTALRTELARREADDEARIYELVEEALVIGDLRPYWAARALYAATSPELTARLFAHEADDVDASLPAGDSVSAQAYERARSIIRERLAAIEEATPTGSTIEAFAVLEDAIAREEEEARAPLQLALEAERRRHARNARNLLRTRLALSLTAGRSYDHFLGNRVAYADLTEEERRHFFKPA
jgi:hypothetical protein